MPIFEGGGLKWWSRTTAVFVAFVVLVAVLIAACLSFDVELLRIITSQQTLKPVVMAPYWPDPVLDASGRLTLDVWPKQQPQRTIDADEKFLGYLPHSGFHNQRMALQNAMVLATYLNRTLLVPPILTGWPIPRSKYSDLQLEWSRLVRQLPRSFNVSDVPPSDQSTIGLPSTAPNFPLDPQLTKRSKEHERPQWAESQCKAHSLSCRWTYNDTFVAWDSVIDMPRIIRRSGLRTFDRWDMRESAIMTMLNVTSRDILVIEDERTNDFVFTTDVHPKQPLIAYDERNTDGRRSVSIPEMAKLEQKVLLLGTLFSTSKIQFKRGTEPKLDYFFFGSQAVFANPIVVRAAEAIAESLGGRDAFVGLHARVTEHRFAPFAENNMAEAWQRIVNKLRIDKKAVHAMQLVIDDQLLGGSKKTKQKPTMMSRHVRRQHQSSHRRTTSIRSASKLRDCPRPLHTKTAFLPFNVPLYLATDAPSPADEPSLRRFFVSFPCLFTLADFQEPGTTALRELADVERLVNPHDGVKFGRQWVPFVEAAVIAMGRVTIGTPGSTFSAFASHELHQAYHSNRTTLETFTN